MPIPILYGQRITLGVTGSIACYKAVGLASALHQAGAIVDVALTPETLQFLRPLVFEAITHRRAFADLWAPGTEVEITHVALGQQSNLVVVVPATAHMLAKLAHGLADDPVSVTVLTAHCPVIVAPAMDAGMYTHPATRANVAVLRERGVHVIEPQSGRLASGLSGLGRLADQDTLVDTIRSVLGASGPLAGHTVAVTAGGTEEPVDPVRVITNRSSGKMGYALAEAARDRGAHVILLSAPTALPVPGGVEVVHVRTARQMQEALFETYDRLDALIMAAAVSDFFVVNAADRKVPRSAEGLTLRLLPNDDILAAISTLRDDSPPVRIGFAAETHDLLEHAREKLGRKHLDLIVANDVSRSDSGFQVDTNQVSLLWADGRREDLPLLAKTDVAEHVLDACVGLLATRTQVGAAAAGPPGSPPLA